MSLVQGKFIADDAVTGDKLKLTNDQYLRGRNNADDGDINIVKVNTSDVPEFGVQPIFGGSQLATESYVDTEISNLGAVFVYEGSWNANTNTPTLADGGGTAGQVYRVSVAGTQDLGSGSITYEVGDKVVYNDAGVWEKWDVIDNEFATSDTDDLAEGAVNFYYTETRFDTSFSGKDTDDLSEGVTNLYFTETRVEDTTLANYTVGADAALANTDDVKGAFGKLQGQINALSAASTNAANEVITLNGTDISNGYVEISQPATTVLSVTPVGGLKQEPTVDYTLSTPVTNTRITFAGDLATLLANGDKLMVAYLY